MTSSASHPPRPTAQVPAKRPARARPGVLARAGKWIGAFFGQRLIDVEYRLRTASPFTHGRGAPRVFYPGCSLTAADPELVLRAYEWLKARDPEIELWSDCCGMPLEKFSTKEAAERGRARTRKQLADAGTREIITACGNCSVQFQSLKVPGLQLTSLYGLLAEEDWGPRATSEPTVVHHPCSARIDKSQQQHFKRLAGKLHLDVVNLDDPKHALTCCLVKSDTAKAKRAALKDAQLVTYCAHCTMGFQSDVPTRHVLQEIFGTPEERWKPKGKVERFREYQRFARLASAKELPALPASSDASHAPDAPEAARKPWMQVALALVALAIVALVAGHADLGRRSLEIVSWARDAGPLGALVFGAAYVAATVLALPGSVLTLGAGFAWGPVLGVAIVSPVSVLAATAAFALGRTLLRAPVARRIGRSPRLAAIDRAIGDNGLRLVILLRLSPVLPFNALNYALALTRVRTRDYVLGSILGMFPATVLYVYFGSLVTSGTELLSGRHAQGLATTLLYVGGFVATLLAVVVTTRLARAELKRALAEPSA